MIFAILSRVLSKENTINNNKVCVFFIFAPVLIEFSQTFALLFSPAGSCRLPVVSKCKTCFKEVDV